MSYLCSCSSPLNLSLLFVWKPFLIFQILRKLTFTDSTSQPSHIVQRCSHRNRYVQQINRTPNRCKIAPSPEHAAVNAFQTSPSNNSLILADYHHSNNNRHHTNLNIKKCFQSGRKSSNKQGSPPKDHDPRQSHRHCITASTFYDEEIIFTENKIYVGIGDASNSNGNMPVNTKHSIGCEMNDQLFPKVKLNRQQHPVSPAQRNCGSASCPDKQNANNILRQLYPCETSTDVSFNANSLQSTTSSLYDYEDVDGSPTKRLSEYDNLNESFWHSHESDNSGCTSCCGCDGGPRASNKLARSSTVCDHMASGDSHKQCVRNNHNNSNNNRSTYADTWDFINGRIGSVPIPPTANPNMIQNKYEIHYESAVSASSRRTSISTIETWIEDEVFDNSFNEELEKRCAQLCTKCHWLVKAEQ